MPIEEKMENWENIAKKLKTAGMKQIDIKATKSQADAIHSLDQLAFESDLPFLFYPIKSPGRYAAGYNTNHYHVYVEGMGEDISESQKILKNSWPEYTHEFIDSELICYSFGAEIVRLRAQNELDIGLFTPEHAGKITKIPILNNMITACSQIPAVKAPDRFDAHVIGTYAATIIYEIKRDSVVVEQIVRTISELVKLDAKKV